MIVGVNSIIKPDLTVVDGIVALGKYPIKLGLVIAGTDSLAVDYTAAKIIGYDNPRRIRYIWLAEKRGVGNLNVESIGEDVNSIRKQFPKLNTFLFSLLWDLQLKGVKIYTTITGDIVPPVLGDL